MRCIKYIILFVAAWLICSCSKPGDIFIDQDSLPVIFPDYCDVTVPMNIAPLNFMLVNDCERLIAYFAGPDVKITVRGRDKIKIPAAGWRKLLNNSSNGSVTVTLFARIDGEWNRYKPFSINISTEAVDPWIVYRLIAPGYETWSEMGIYQRNLTAFNQEPVINNRLLPGGCMNCHSFRSNDPGNMMLHLRGNIGGTILVQDGKTVRLNTKVKETISNCVYPYWHPSEDFIAYSVNNIQQVFHSVKEKRIEVIDFKSDIVVYDIKANKIITSEIISSEGSFETFPSFTPDGKSLLFCSAKKGVQPDEYDKIKYSLCKVDFDASTGTFGDRIDTLVSSFQTGKSVSFPRVSPDGKLLAFTLSDYGNFSIWHREADLYQLEMNTGDFKPIGAINSPETESYHSWSSNSRWMIFSSRRMDGLYTHPYIAFVDEGGNFKKPFMVPQKDPEYYQMSLRSFNVPEFVTGKVTSDGRSMLKAIGSPAKDVDFELRE